MFYVALISFCNHKEDLRIISDGFRLDSSLKPTRGVSLTWVVEWFGPATALTSAGADVER